MPWSNNSRWIEVQKNALERNQFHQVIGCHWKDRIRVQRRFRIIKLKHTRQQYPPYTQKQRQHWLWKEWLQCFLALRTQNTAITLTCMYLNPTNNPYYISTFRQNFGIIIYTTFPFYSIFIDSIKPVFIKFQKYCTI